MPEESLKASELKTLDLILVRWHHRGESGIYSRKVMKVFVDEETTLVQYRLPSGLVEDTVYMNDEVLQVLRRKKNA